MHIHMHSKSMVGLIRLLILLACNSPCLRSGCAARSLSPHLPEALVAIHFRPPASMPGEAAVLCFHIAGLLKQQSYVFASTVRLESDIVLVSSKNLIVNDDEEGGLKLVEMSVPPLIEGVYTIHVAIEDATLGMADDVHKAVLTTIVGKINVTTRAGSRQHSQAGC